MMCKVVDYRDAAFFATYFRASLDVLKGRKRALDLFFADSPRIRGDDHCKTVQKIELAEQRRLKFSPRLVLAKDFKT